jgi:hypothetical protein
MVVSEDIRLDDALAFFYVDHTIDFNLLQLINVPAGPSYFDEINFGRLVQPKMDPQIVLGKITAATAYFIYLLERLLDSGHAGDAPDPRANATAI